MADWVGRVVKPAMPPLIGCPADEDTALRQVVEQHQILEEGA